MATPVYPKVSIIVPVYKVEDVLPKCLDSLCGQTYQNLEIICVNDGSPDGSPAILAQYAARDKRVKVIDKPNSGVSSARNAGILQASGEYVMFVDSDDWIDEKTCEAAVEEARQSGADLVFWNYVREFENKPKPRCLYGDARREFNGRQETEALQRRCAGPYGETVADLSSAHSFGTVWGKLFRAAIVKKSGLQFIDLKIIGNEDELYLLEALEDVKKAVYLPAYFYHYRKANKHSLTQSYRRDLVKQWECLHKKMRDYITLHHKDESYSIALDNRISYSIVDLGINVLRSDMSMGEKIKEIERIISTPEYKKAVSSLQLSALPPHWKVLFFCAKKRWAFFVYLLLAVLKRLSGN